MCLSRQEACLKLNMLSYPYKCLFTADILCIQEPHLSPVPEKFLTPLDSDYDVHDQSGNNYIRQGGLAILWRKDIGYSISEYVWTLTRIELRVYKS